MEEVQIREKSMEELAEEIKALLDGLEKSARRTQDIDDLEERFNTYETHLDAMQMEIKSLSPADKKKYKKIFRTFKKDLKEMKNDFEWKKSNKVRDELMDGAIRDKESDLNTADGMMTHGTKVLAESGQALQRIQGTVKVTMDIAVATAAKLAEQQKQLEKIFEDLKSIDSTLARSTRVMKRIGRKIATDKYMWVLIFLVIFFILFIIIWKAVGKSSPSVNTPTTLPNS